MQFKAISSDSKIPSLKILPDLSPIIKHRINPDKSSYHQDYSPNKPRAPNPRFMPKSYSQSVLGLARRTEAKTQYPDWKSNMSRQPEIAKETPLIRTFENVKTS